VFWPIRYRLVGLLTVGSMINFIDRVNISVAAPVIMPALGWDEAKFGVIFSAFLAGYTLFQFPGGLIADRWSPKKVVAISCLGFSLFTALTPLGGLAFLLMLILRFCVGMFESVSFPAYASINSRWIPRREYGRAQTISLSGSYLGQTLAYPLTTWLVLTLSWQWSFYFNALLGLLWIMIWLAFATDDPAQHRKITKAELADIEENRAARPSAPVSFWSVLKTRQVLFLSLSYLCLVYGVWMIILWLPYNNKLCRFSRWRHAVGHFVATWLQHAFCPSSGASTLYHSWSALSGNSSPGPLGSTRDLLLCYLFIRNHLVHWWLLGRSFGA